MTRAALLRSVIKTAARSHWAHNRTARLIPLWSNDNDKPRDPDVAKWAYKAGMALQVVG